jgi:hypothetical protein
MSNPTRTFINEKLGGTEAVAERLSKSEGAVRMWAHRKRVPRAVWPEILSSYENVTLGDLKALEGLSRAA